MNKWRNEEVNKWINELMNKLIMNDWIIEWLKLMNESFGDWIAEWMNKVNTDRLMNVIKCLLYAIE